MTLSNNRLISMIDFSSIFKMFAFHTECSRGSFSMTFVYDMHYFHHSKNQLWQFHSSQNLLTFPFSLCLALICVCLWFLKKTVVNILKIELVLIPEEQCLLAVCDKKEGKTRTWSSLSEANWHCQQNCDLINISLDWKLVYYKDIFCMAGESREITGCKMEGKLRCK